MRRAVSVMRLRALEQILDDPSVLFARRAMGTVLGLGLLALSVVLSIALATWTVSDPSFTHATDGAVQNAMGAFGAAFADPVMQIFGVAAPLLILPLPLWGLRLVSGRPVGWTPGRLGAGLAALFLAPGFVNVFPVTQSWPLPLGLGGVVGSIHNFLWADVFGIGSGALLGFLGGFTGLLAAVALVSAIAPVRRRERPADLGFTIRRSRMEPDEYGLDDTDAYESEASSRLAELYGAMQHSVMMLRTRLMGPKSRHRKAAPQRAAPRSALREALVDAPDADAGQDVYRSRRAERPRRESVREAEPHPQDAFALESRRRVRGRAGAAAAPGAGARAHASRRPPRCRSAAAARARSAPRAEGGWRARPRQPIRAPQRGGSGRRRSRVRPPIARSRGPLAAASRRTGHRLAVRCGRTRSGRARSEPRRRWRCPVGRRDGRDRSG